MVYARRDDAPPHFSNLVRQHLSNTFGIQWIGRGGPISWPPRSPDMTPLDFFLWGNLKRLYSTPVHTREDLIERITQHCNEIRNNPRMLFQVQRENIRRTRKFSNLYKFRKSLKRKNVINVEALFLVYSSKFSKWVACTSIHFLIRRMFSRCT